MKTSSFFSVPPKVSSCAAGQPVQIGEDYAVRAFRDALTVNFSSRKIAKSCI